MLQKLGFFLAGCAFMLAVANSLPATDVLFSEAVASEGTRHECRVVAEQSRGRFLDGLREYQRNSTVIVSSNLSYSPGGNVWHYALVCAR